MSAIRLPPLPTIRDLVKLYRLRAMKQLSQNFLMDERLTDKLVKQAGNITNGYVLEVGPGPGGLTRSIIRRKPKKLIVVEKDPRFLPTLELLSEAFSNVGGDMDIVIGDINTTNLNIFPDTERKEWTDYPPNIHLIGNLPFNVSTHLIITWLQHISERSGAWSMGRSKMTLTFQKEVAERLVAAPCAPNRCRLSIMAQAWTKPQLRFIIPGKAFVPKPEVDVGVVTFTPLQEPLTRHEFSTFEKVTRHIFSFRQKYVIRCIQTLFPEYCRDELGMLMCKLSDIDPKYRPFQISVDEMDRLCTAYTYLCEKHPEIIKYNYRASRRIVANSETLDIVVEEMSTTA